MIDLDWNPSNRKLRQFAGCGLVIVPVAAWWWRASGWQLGMLILLSMLTVLLAWRLPRLLRPLYVVVSLVSLPVGWVVGELLLGLIYFGVFMPIGLAFRCLGRDVLGWRLDKQRETYWEDVVDDADATSYYRRY